MSRPVTLALIIAGALMGQNQAVKAPPRVDQALRGRVAEFYQACVDKKYRIAEGIVAEKDRDLFYEAEKPVYREFKVERVTYSKDLKNATVSTTVGMDFRMPGQPPIAMKRPLETAWTLIDGQWFLVLDTGVVRTPFGDIKKAPPGSAPRRPGMPPGMGAGSAPVAPPDIHNLVKADKPEVSLGPSAQTQTVTLTNTMGGQVTMSVDDPGIAGLSVSLDRSAVPSGGQARLTLVWKGAPKPPVTGLELRIRLKELPITVPVRVLFPSEK